MLSANELQRIITEARTFLEGRLRETLEGNREFWADLADKPLHEFIDAHLVPDHDLLNVAREEILSRLLVSIQNRQSSSNVIGGSIDGGWSTLAEWLEGFRPEAILARWPEPDDLLTFFREQSAAKRIRGKFRTETQKSLWPQFARSVLSAAKFMARYPTAQAFRDWLDSFIHSDDTIAALPLILSQEVFGLGLPLAADFLKELGCHQFPKPDTHIWRLATALGISDAETDYRLMLDIMKAARSIDMTPGLFNADQIAA